MSLGTLDDPGSSAVLRRVNVLGEAVGGYKDGKTPRNSSAFMASPAGGFKYIADQQATDFSALYGINDLGEIAGTMNRGSNMLPFRTVRDTGFQWLPLLAEDTGGGAYGINDQGESVGFSGGPKGARAAWWTRSGTVAELASPPGSNGAKAIDINHRGDIVGYAGDNPKVAVLWQKKGSPTQLGTLASYENMQAESISDNGDVVGSAQAFDPTVVRMRAVLWSAGSTLPQDLGVLSGGVASRARDVDNNGLVVGTSDSSDGNHAFFWTAATGMQDLNSVSADQTIVLVDALSINSQGAILAVGIKKSDFPPGNVQNVEEHELPRQIVLLTPVN